VEEPGAVEAAKDAAAKVVEDVKKKAA